MPIDGARADREPGRNLLISQSVRHQVQDFRFAPGQPNSFILRHIVVIVLGSAFLRAGNKNTGRLVTRRPVVLT